MLLGVLLEIIGQIAKSCLANPEHGPSRAIHNVIRAIIAAMPEGQKELAQSLHGFMAVLDRTECPHHMAVRLLEVLAPIIASARASEEKEVQDVIPDLVLLQEHILLVRDREPSCHDVKKRLVANFVAAITAYSIVYGETEEFREFMAYVKARGNPASQASCDE
jgi:hypothetical protein